MEKSTIVNHFVVPDAPATDVPGLSLNEILVHDGAAGLFEDLLARYAVHSGISGVQPKVMLRRTGNPTAFTAYSFRPEAGPFCCPEPD